MIRGTRPDGAHGVGCTDALCYTNSAYCAGALSVPAVQAFR